MVELEKHVGHGTEVCECVDRNGNGVLHKTDGTEYEMVVVL